MKDMTVQERIQLVRWAIERFDKADKAYRDAEADATADADDRGAAKMHKESTEREFAWQLNNVRAILDHYSLKHIGLNALVPFLIAEIPRERLRAACEQILEETLVDL